ncbi:MAG: hypothetical protein GY750_06810 [Lentisphaerae bacterium]|nr:hypothetical protein [Lentisphaerota bacterium]
MSHSDENNESFPHIIPFTISSDKERNCYEPAKDLITASMKLESWEMLTYFDPSSNQFEYLPFKEAHAVSFIEYLNVNLPQNDSNDNGVLEYSYRAMISTIIFLIGIYGFDGHPTNNAGRILKWMRFEKKKKHTKQLFSRGCNTQFWYPKPPTPSIPYKYVFDRLVR